MTIVLLLPIIAILIYTIIYPKESLLLGRRSQFKNENLEPREEAVKNTRIQGIVALVIIVMVMIFQFIK